MARKTSYKKVYAEQAKHLCLLGATNKDLAKFFKCSVKTITNWQNDHPEFLRALKDAKAEADARVIKSLFERATGYEHEDLYITQYGGKIISKKITKHYPPDVTACIFWLKNRLPEDWREKPEPEEMPIPPRPEGSFL